MEPEVPPDSLPGGVPSDVVPTDDAPAGLAAPAGAEAVAPAMSAEECAPAVPRDTALGPSIPAEALIGAGTADILTGAISPDPAILVKTIQSAYETERRRADALAERDLAKTAFFSHVTDEFRTPLTLILGPAADLLAGGHGRLSDEQREQIATVRRNGVHLLKLVDTLITFLRIDAGRVDALFEPTDLAAFTTELASLFRSAFERGGLALAVDCQRLNDPVYVDRDMWEKVVLNLLSNALKFTFDGRVDVALRTVETEVELLVSDTGIGIAEEDVSHLFTRFHRIPGARGRTKEGSGIGLALVHELVRIHGGAVSVTSQPGAGSTFSVRLPMGRAHLPEDRVRDTKMAPPPSVRGASAFVEDAVRWLANADAQEPPASDEVANGFGLLGLEPARPRVLIADDHADIRSYLTRLLGQQCRVEAVADGHAALEAARARRPDLVIADVMMPRLDGFALVQALRADVETSHIPVLLCSGRAGEESRVDGLHAGAVDYLAKPFSSRDLVARVQNQLARARLRSQADLERARLRTLFTEAPIAICIFRGPDHLCEFANSPFAQLVGGRDLVGRTAREALPELESDGLFQALDGVYRTGETYWGVEIPVHLARRERDTRPGEEVYFNVVYQAMRGPSGEIDAVMVFALDVTDQVHARRRIEEDIVSRDAFLAAAAHELRNPIDSLQMQLLTILRAVEREAQTPALDWVQERVGRAAAQVARLIRLLDTLLDLSRMASGRVPLVLEDVDLGEVVVEVVSRLEPAHRAQIVSMVSPARGTWDRMRVDQVVTNLISNALKYGEGQPIHIVVASDARAVRLEVTDRGIGIAVEHQQRIFERFERAVADRHYAGFGLGLWITSRIVEEFGGSMSLRSELGEGSTFIVELPQAPPSR